MRCLLIEDNAANSYLVEVLLTRRGHEVNVARTGAEAVAMSRLQPFDVILIDLNCRTGTAARSCRNWRQGSGASAARR